MKKLLITGGSGFLGSRLATFYKETYDILTPRHAELDITDEASVDHFFALHKPDFVVHCAAISEIPICEKEPERSWQINVTGSENIAKYSAKYGAKPILCSSDQVYCGSTHSAPNKEDEPLHPRNVYAKEKAHAEKSCLQLHKDSVHLRLPWMYDAKASDQYVRNDFIRQIKSCISKREPLKFSSNDTRGISDVWEIVENIEKAFSLPGGVYNFGSINEESTYQTALQIFEALHYDASLIQEIQYETARNISMNQEKINRFGIYFSSTKDAAIRCLKD